MEGKSEPKKKLCGKTNAICIARIGMERMCTTQLDICNIYTSKFRTKPKLIRGTHKKKTYIPPEYSIGKRYKAQIQLEKKKIENRSAQHASSKHNVAIYALCSFVKAIRRKCVLWIYLFLLNFCSRFHSLISSCHHSINIWTSPYARLDYP